MAASYRNGVIILVGNVGGAVTDFMALGDTVNVAARMQGEAAAGELLIREGVGSQPLADTPRRTLNLRVAPSDTLAME